MESIEITKECEYGNCNGSGFYTENYRIGDTIDSEVRVCLCHKEAAAEELGASLADAEKEL